MKNVVYLGRFSEYATERLNSYVDSYDIVCKIWYRNPPECPVEEPDRGQRGTGRVHMVSVSPRFSRDVLQRSSSIMDDTDQNNGENTELILYILTIYWHEQPIGRYGRKDERIVAAGMQLDSTGEYQLEIMEKSLDENTQSVRELFERSPFYKQFVDMCANGY